MGALDQFAKQLWADELEVVTDHAVRFEAAVEVTITHVQLDGVITPVDKTKLRAMTSPWNMAESFDSIVVDFKMPGDHVDSRALLLLEQRRANWVAELLKQKQVDNAQNVASWMVHCRLPAELESRAQMISPGCYEMDNSAGKNLFVVANELPLKKELIPFLVARDGVSLVELGRWLIRNQHKPVQWILNRVRTLPMTEEQRMELLRRLPADDLRELVKLQMRGTSQILRFLEANDPAGAQQALNELTVEQRLEGLDPTKIAANLPTKIRLAGLDPKQRLEGLDPKTRLEGLDPKQVAVNLPAAARLEGLDPEQRLSDLDAAHAVLAMPNEVLRVLPAEYIATLPDDVQARIRERLAK